MINIIYGIKGSGKTERIIAAASKRAEESKGCVVYLTDRKEHSLAVGNDVRFVDVKAYGISCEKCAIAFLKGLLAGNYDITDIFIDGLAKFTNQSPTEQEGLYKELELLSTEHNVDFTLTVSIGQVPDFMKKYL